MVTQFDNKRDVISKRLQIDFKIVDKAELGVCMGYDEMSNSNLFSLANRMIVLRKSTQQLSSTFVPFNWRPKEYVIRVPLSQEPLPNTNHVPIIGPAAAPQPSQPPISTTTVVDYP